MKGAELLLLLLALERGKPQGSRHKAHFLLLGSGKSHPPLAKSPLRCNGWMPWGTLGESGGCRALFSGAAAGKDPAPKRGIAQAKRPPGLNLPSQLQSRLPPACLMSSFLSSPQKLCPLLPHSRKREAQAAAAAAAAYLMGSGLCSFGRAPSLLSLLSPVSLWAPFKRSPARVLCTPSASPPRGLQHFHESIYRQQPRRALAVVFTIYGH